jgi:hypothetical protein
MKIISNNTKNNQTGGKYQGIVLVDYSSQTRFATVNSKFPDFKQAIS